MTAFDRLPDLLRALNDEKVDYVLFGGQAINLHGIPRFTEDIDLFGRRTLRDSGRRCTDCGAIPRSKRSRRATSRETTPSSGTEPLMASTSTSCLG